MEEQLRTNYICWTEWSAVKTMGKNKQRNDLHTSFSLQAITTLGDFTYSISDQKFVYEVPSAINNNTNHHILYQFMQQFIINKSACHKQK